MRVSIVHAHPEPRSFNVALTQEQHAAAHEGFAEDDYDEQYELQRRSYS